MELTLKICLKVGGEADNLTLHRQSVCNLFLPGISQVRRAGFHREGNYLFPIYMVLKVSLFIPQLCFPKQTNKQTNKQTLICYPNVIV